MPWCKLNHYLDFFHLWPWRFRYEPAPWLELKKNKISEESQQNIQKVVPSENRLNIVSWEPEGH